MTLGSNKMKKLNSIPAKLTVSALTTMSLMTLSSSVFAANTTITNVSTTQTSPRTTELRLSFSGAPVMPKAYALNNPTSLVLDFPAVDSNLPSREQQIQTGLIESSKTVSTANHTRMTLMLQEKGRTTSRIEGNDLILTVSDNTPLSTFSQSQNTVSPIIEKTGNTSSFQKIRPGKEKMVVRVNPLLQPTIGSAYMSQDSYDGLSAVNFSGNDTSGNITIDLTNKSIPIDVQRQGNKLLVRMVGSKVPRNLVRSMNVNGALVRSIDARNNGKNGTVIINMNDEFEYQAYQSEDRLSITVTPIEKEADVTMEAKVYKGEPLSMEFQDVEIRNVLDILGEFTKMNIVVSDDVSGSITLRLINVPWDQALDVILKSKGLGKRENGNVVFVAPAQKLIEQEQKELEALVEKEAVKPIHMEHIKLSYAKALEVQALIVQASASSSSSSDKDDKNKSGSGSGSLLSKRGTVSVDSRTNSLVVQDTSDSIANIRSLIAKIDIPVKQIMIEARIVSATDNFSKDMGIKWGILSSGLATNDSLLVGGSDQTLWDLKEFEIETTKVAGGEVSYPKYDISRPDNLNVNLGASNAAGKIAFTLLNMSDHMLDLELSAMQADNKGEVISNPKVLTVDKQTAKISSGTQIPFLSTSGEGTKTEFIEASLSLQVTPNITPDGKIGLNLDIANGSPVVFNGKTVIAEDSIQTNVLVEDGQTVVLGGVYKNSVTNGVSKVPFFGDLPYVGKLFRNDKKTNKKNELLIFITTRVVNDGVSNF